MRTALLVVITTTALMSPAYALNRCVDSTGKVNYTDMPCEAEEKSGAVNLSGVGKSDVPQVDRDASRFTTSNRTAAIQAYLAKTEAERAHEKEYAKQKQAADRKGPKLPSDISKMTPAEQMKELERIAAESGLAPLQPPLGVKPVSPR